MKRWHIDRARDKSLILRISGVLGIAMTAAALPVSTSAQVEPRISLSPNDPTHGGAVDFWSMFQPGANWTAAKNHVQVISIAQNLVTNGPPDRLKVFFSYLRQNHIKLAISIGMLTWTDQCGKHVEGYVPPGGSNYVAKRIKWLGGDLSYIDVDEALWFGRYYSGKNACHTSIDALAKDVAANFKAYQAVFPDVKLGDTEPLGPPPTGDRAGNWAGYTRNWIEQLQAAADTHLAFVHEDITDWGRPLNSYLPAVSNLVRSMHIPFGPIVIAADAKGPDDAWMRSAESNLERLRACKAWPPDELVFATWHIYPTHNLPETSSSAFVHLIDYYLDTR